MQAEVGSLYEARAFENLAKNHFAPRPLRVIGVATQSYGEFVGFFAEFGVELLEFADFVFERCGFLQSVLVVFADGVVDALEVVLNGFENFEQTRFVGLLKVGAVLPEDVVGDVTESFFRLSSKFSLPVGESLLALASLAKNFGQA